jgi:FKBP-type peptidyl-prolyl cis-trans isomerase FkpA
MRLLPRLAALGLLAASSIALVPAAWAQTDAALDAAAKEANARVTSTGLIFRSLQEGTGASPKSTDKVKVHYRGSFPDGREFDSSYKRNEPTEFPLNRVIPCWTEGVQLMKIGGKAKLTCPSAIAYGKRGFGGTIPPDSTLVFEIELLAINGK